MNVLLVYPQFPITFWSYTYALRFIGRRALGPPLGLLTVAAMLPREWPVRLVDLNVHQLRAEDLAWADYVWLSAMAIQQNSAREVVTRAHRAGVPVVAGGPLFSAQPDIIPAVDCLVLNEAELTLPPFLADLCAGRLQPRYATTAYADMTLSPTPRFELAAIHRYAMMPIQYSRGCPFDCEFCDVTAQLGRRPRHKTVSQVLAELDALKALGWHRGVFLVDDNLIGSRQHLKTELLPALIAWQRRRGPLVFNAQVSIDLADDPDLVTLLARAGINTVFIGIETPDVQTLRACHKRQNTHRDLLADVKHLQAAGITVQAGFIVGFDHDTPSIFQRQIDFIQASGITTAMVGLLQALKGTRLHRRMQRENRLRQESAGDNVGAMPNFIPAMSEHDLRAGYRKLLAAIYSPPYYYQRAQTFLRNYRRPPIPERLQWQDIRAFLRAHIVLGVLGRERFRYWRFLVWTLCHQPWLLPKSVELAVLGHHFRLVCARYSRALRRAAAPRVERPRLGGVG